MGLAAAAVERFGWSLGAVRDEVPLVMLRLLLSQPGPNRPDRSGMTTADMDMIDWMDANGIEPGDTF